MRADDRHVIRLLGLDDKRTRRHQASFLAWIDSSAAAVRRKSLTIENMNAVAMIIG